MEFNLDEKDMKILRILDSNFRMPFSRIAKKVGLSKNSVGLRFQRLKKLMSHNAVAINNQRLGYTLVKFFYIIDSFDSEKEEVIVRELKKLKQVIYAARHYGHYNLEIAMFVKNFWEINDQINILNKKISKMTENKEIEVISKEFFFENRFLFEKYSKKPRDIVSFTSETQITESDKKILSILRDNPRMTLLELSEKSSLNLKTVISRIKRLEREGIIIGYFMMLDYSKFNLSAFKLLIQVSNVIEEDLFEKYLCSIKNVKHFSRMLGPWDYEVDFFYSSVLELQQEIERLKQCFPNQIKKIEIISHGKRIFTNHKGFLYHKEGEDLE